MTLVTETAPAAAPNYQVFVPDELLEYAKRDANCGVSFDPADRLMPFLRVLQSNSPMCSKRDPAFVEGAEPGHFFLRGALDPIRNGETGIIVQVCAMERQWVEFRPSRGGFVASHAEPPGDAVKDDIYEDGRTKTVLMRSTNKHIIQDTRALFILVEGSPFVLGCTSTMHTFAKELNGDMRNRLHPETGQVLPSFLHKYKLVTTPVSNALGRWFGLRFAYVGPTSPTEYIAGRQLHQVVMNGRARVEAPTSRDT
jgi:hypothetical protein